MYVFGKASKTPLDFVNLTPHPVTFPLSWYCWLGEPRDALAEEGWELIDVPGLGDMVAEWVTVPPSGQVARLAEIDREVRRLQVGLNVEVDMATEWGVTTWCVDRHFGLVENLPDPSRGNVYIVSLPCLMGMAAAGVFREDVVAPDTGPSSVVRTEDGQIKAVRRFVRIKPEGGR